MGSIQRLDLMHLLKDGFVEEGLVFAAIAPAAVSNFLHFGEQVFSFEKDVAPFCNDEGQDLVHSW